MTDRATSGDPLWDERFTIIPNLLLKHYVKLGITEVELVFLLQLIKRAWWDKENAFPFYDTIAEEMGKERRTIIRIARGLCTTYTWKDEEGEEKTYKGKGFIVIIPRIEKNGQTSNDFNFKPLFEALRKIALKERENEGVTNLSLGGDKSVTGGGDKSVTQKQTNPGKQTKETTTTARATSESTQSDVVVSSAKPKGNETDSVVVFDDTQKRYAQGLEALWVKFIKDCGLSDNSQKSPQEFFHKNLAKYSYERIRDCILGMRFSAESEYLYNNPRGFLIKALQNGWEPSARKVPEGQSADIRAKEEWEATRRENTEKETCFKKEQERWKALSLEEKVEEALNRKIAWKDAIGEAISEIGKQELRREYMKKFREESKMVSDLR